jgi:hypothetical protein
MQWDFGWQAILLTIGVFLLRICDVSIGTVRVLFTIRGKPNREEQSGGTIDFADSAD